MKTRPLPLFLRFALFGGLMIGGSPETWADPALVETPEELKELQFFSRQQQSYTLKFMAMPDADHFQITRLQTAAWRERETFFLRLGEKSPDNQFKVESVEKKEAANEQGIVEDASELTITHLPSGEQAKLVRGVNTVIPTYYAEFKSGGQKFYVKKGDPFVLPNLPAMKLKVFDVKEDSAEVSFENAEGKEVKVSIEKAK